VVNKGKITETQMAYLAGMIDGDGHVGVYKTMGRSNMRYRARVCVINTDVRLINWLLEVFGGFVKNNKSKNKNHKDRFVWQLADNDADEVLSLIRPFLVIKAEQTDLVLAYRKLQKISKTKPGYTNISTDTRELVYQTMKQLNRRGPSESVETNTPDISGVLMKIESELTSNGKNRICEGLVARN
jgi:hypothetical protein